MLFSRLNQSCVFLVVVFLLTTACGSRGTYYNDVEINDPDDTINPPGQNSIGIAGESLLSGGITQSENFDLHAFITPYAATVLTSDNYQISDITLANQNTQGESQ